MAMVELTNVQILDKLQNDYEFGINFIIDNNPEGVEANLNANNFLLQPNPTRSQLKAKINEIIDLGQGELAIEILQVPYLNQADNYTGNLEQPLKQIGRNNGVPQPRAVAIAIISLVATIGGGILAVKQQQQETEALQIQAEMQEQVLEAERERNNILGVPKTLFYALIGIVALVIIVIAIRK